MNRQWTKMKTHTVMWWSCCRNKRWWQRAKWFGWLRWWTGYLVSLRQCSISPKCEAAIWHLHTENHLAEYRCSLVDCSTCHNWACEVCRLCLNALTVSLMSFVDGTLVSLLRRLGWQHCSSHSRETPRDSPLIFSRSVPSRCLALSLYFSGLGSKSLICFLLCFIGFW